MAGRIEETPVRRIEKGLASRYPLFYVQCGEEDRLEALLGQLATTHYGAVTPIQVWTSTEGFAGPGKAVDGTRDPLQALRSIAAADRDGFFLLKDFPALFDDLNLVRGLRNLYQQLANRNRFVFMSHPQLRIPEPLSHQLFVVELGLPTEREIYEHLTGIAADHHVLDQVADEVLARSAAAMKGMALNEVGHLYRRLIAEDKLHLDAALPEIHEEKAAALLKEACL